MYTDTLTDGQIDNQTYRPKLIGCGHSLVVELLVGYDVGDVYRASVLTPTYRTAMGYLPISEIEISPLSLMIYITMQSGSLSLLSFLPYESYCRKSIIEHFSHPLTDVLGH